MSKKKIEEYAKQRTDEITSTLAALHDPDQVVGGFFSEIKHMGNRNANSAIGGSWSGKRVNQLLESAKRLQSAGATKMNISLTTK